MARKKVAPRLNLPQETLDRARREASGEILAPAPARVVTSANPGASAAIKKTTVEDLAHEYGYVATDLRNMAILAAVLFAGLILISFIL